MSYRRCAAAFSAIGSYDGYVITKMEYEKVHAPSLPEGKTGGAACSQKKRGTTYAVLESSLSEDGWLERMSLHLLLPKEPFSDRPDALTASNRQKENLSKPSFEPMAVRSAHAAETGSKQSAGTSQTASVPDALQPCPVPGEASVHPFAPFTAEEVREFVTAVGDSNPIHGRPVPIVPGLLILERLLSYFGVFARPEGTALRAQIRFRRPLLAGQAFCLLAEDATEQETGGDRTIRFHSYGPSDSSAGFFEGQIHYSLSQKS